MALVKALTKEQSKFLLPSEFLPAIDVPGAKQSVHTPMGVMAFHQSSQLRDGGWKTSHSEEEIRKYVDYVLFAVGYEGILILPRNLLLSFFNDKVNGRYSNDRYKINVYKSKDRFVWRCRNGHMIDVSPYFVKSTVYC